MSEPSADVADVVYAEPGARWRIVLYGPLLCVVVAISEAALGQRVHWPVLLICALLLAGLVAMIVSAARTHVCVELTATQLTNGTETVDVSEIAQIFPERDEESWDDEPWEAARVLGELPNVPRGRTGIGLELDRGLLVRTWARNDERLREGLIAVLGGPNRMEGDVQ